MKTVAVLVLKTHGAGYQAVQLASREPKLSVMEIIPLGAEFQVLIQGSREHIEKLLSQLSSTDLLFADFIDEWSSYLEKAFYSLEHASLETEMIIVEGSRLGRLLSAASTCEKLGYKIVDLKIPRGSNRWGVLILTAAGADKRQEKLIFDDLLVTRLADPTETVRRYFQIEA